jgi:hypothetical protein
MHICLILPWQDYENVFINAQGSGLEHIRDRLAGFIVSKVISRKGEFHFSSIIIVFMFDDSYSLCNS